MTKILYHYEYVSLGLNDKTLLPLEKQVLYFYENGYYKIENELLSNHRNLVENALSYLQL
jgi:hypothetical protein